MERLCDLQAELTSALEEQVNDVDILKVNPIPRKILSLWCTWGVYKLELVGVYKVE